MNPASAGGAIAVFGDVKVDILNSTFYGNSSLTKGGAISNGGTSVITLTNVTIAGNVAPGAAALDANGKIVLRNSIISDNSPQACGGFGTLVNGGGNLVWPATDATCPGTKADPKLQMLTAANDSYVMSMPVGFGSGALGLGRDFCPATDTHGQRRLLAPAFCDAGAYEHQVYMFLPLITNK